MLNIGETETESHFRIRVSTERLLSRLIAHHDYTVPNLKLPEVLLVPNPEPKPVWFSVVEEVDPMAEILAACPKVEDIQRIVAKHFGFTLLELVSDRRTKALVLAKHVGFYLCKTLTTRSYPFIAGRFRYFDHSVGIYAVRKINRLLQTDQAVVNHVAVLTAEIQRAR